MSAIQMNARLTFSHSHTPTWIALFLSPVLLPCTLCRNAHQIDSATFPCRGRAGELPERHREWKAQSNPLGNSRTESLLPLSKCRVTNSTLGRSRCPGEHMERRTRPPASGRSPRNDAAASHRAHECPPTHAVVGCDAGRKRGIRLCRSRPQRARPCGARNRVNRGARP